MEGAPIGERTLEIGGVSTHLLESPPGHPPPIVYLHGVPTGAWQWRPFLERIGGIAPDLPGMAGSGKPADFDYSIRGYDRWIEQFADAVGLDRFSLVVHDWGVVGLAFAQRFPERIDRLLVFISVPLLPGYRWHWIARIWRRPGAGEAFMAAARSKRAFRLISRQANATPGPLPDDFIDSWWPDFDRETRSAILKLYRASPEDLLARSGERLGEITCPALVLWSADDPYIGSDFGRGYADALGNAKLELVTGAGHWPWLDRPELIDRAAEFLAPAGPAASGTTVSGASR